MLMEFILLGLFLFCGVRIVMKKGPAIKTGLLSALMLVAGSHLFEVEPLGAIAISVACIIIVYLFRYYFRLVNN